jgi:hypothetical protein
MCAAYSGCGAEFPKERVNGNVGVQKILLEGDYNEENYDTGDYDNIGDFAYRLRLDGCA